MKNKEKLYENISTACFMLALVCGLILIVCIVIIPLMNSFIYFIKNTTFSIQELIVIFCGIGGVIFGIVGTIFYFLRETEEKKRLEHEFRMQFEKKEK